MKEKTGEIFSISNDNPTVKGCTVSKTIYRILISVPKLMNIRKSV